MHTAGKVERAHTDGELPGTVNSQKIQGSVFDAARIVGVRPTRAVTPAEIATFQRDGVVKLEGILPVGTAEFLGDCFDDMFFRDDSVGGGMRMGRGTMLDHQAMADEVEARGQGDTLLAEGLPGQKRTGRFMTEGNCFHWHTDFNRFCSLGPLPEVVAQLLQTSKLQFYHDHCFYKEAGSLLRTGFHQDKSFWGLRGDQVAVCWVPCDVVTRESGAMGYIRGSHKGPTYAPNNLLTTKSSQTMAAHMPDDVPLLPDIEGNEKDFDIIYHEAQPGDVVIHHQNTIHGSAGNRSLERHRRAASIRYIGDDVVYEANKVDSRLGSQAYDPNNTLDPNLNSPEEEKIRQQRVYEQAKKIDGKKLTGRQFPLVWPRPQSDAKI